MPEAALHVGDTITLDEIEVYVLAAKDEGGTWSSDAGAEGVEFIGVDKNHDLSYYVNRSDWVDSTDFNTSPGTFNYEWGGHGTETGITGADIGSGLSNTNSLIGMNLQPRGSGWYVVWDKIKEFRQSHSSNWFLPSKDELNLIYEVRNDLNNLSLNKVPSYWSSSEKDSTDARIQDFGDGEQPSAWKSFHYVRSRLCRYITNSDFYTKKTWVENELITAA